MHVHPVRCSSFQITGGMALKKINDAEPVANVDMAGHDNQRAPAAAGRCELPGDNRGACQPGMQPEYECGLAGNPGPVSSITSSTPVSP